MQGVIVANNRAHIIVTYFYTSRLHVRNQDRNTNSRDHRHPNRHSTRPNVQMDQGARSPLRVIQPGRTSV